jgi:N-acetylglucosaminyldiphosphoundecaprenol N-acetyl-beta-D-mannosaminyltransferase
MTDRNQSSSAVPEDDPMATARFRVGDVGVDVLDLQGALDRIELLVRAGRGGAVFTPNVDHVVNARRVPALARAYSRADLSLADGMPLVWASRLLGPPLPERVAGSDFAEPLLIKAAEQRWRVYLLGGRAGAAEEAASRLKGQGVPVVGADGAAVAPDGSAAEEVLAHIARTRPELLLVGLGSPKQELFIDRYRDRLTGTVAVGCGAVIDFIAGRVPRSPAWMSRAGLEWAYRLAQEPRRLWRRYLLQDPLFVAILLHTWWRRTRPVSAKKN